MFVQIFSVAAALTAPQLDCEKNEILDIALTPRAYALGKNSSTLFIEQGAEVEYSYDGIDWRPIALPATRAAWHVEYPGSVGIKLKTSTVASAKILILSSCRDDLFSNKAWWLNLQNYAEAHDYTVSAKLANPSELDTLLKNAANVEQRGFVIHAMANDAFRVNNLENASTLFKESSKVWGQAGAQFNALHTAANLGSAEVADRRSDPQFRQIVDQAMGQILKAPEQKYFATRFAQIECRFMFLAGNWNDYLPCTEAVIAKYRSLGEISDELNATINLVYASRNVSTNISIYPIQRRLELLPETISNKIYRGRFNLLAAQVAHDNGQLAQALSSIQVAIANFSMATEERERWLVNALLLSADIQAKLGLHEQSFAILSKALELIRANETPSRAAAIFHQLGENFRSADQNTQAATWFSNAAKIRDLANLSAEVAASRLSSLEVSSSPDLISLDNLVNLAPRYSNRATLLRAKILMQAGSATRATEALVKLDELVLSQIEQNLLAMLRSKLAAIGNFQDASLILSNRILAIAQVADEAPTSALAYLTQRSGENVRRAWVDSQTPASEPALVFQTTLLANPARFMTSVVSPLKTEEPVAKQSPGEVGFLAQLTGPQGKSPERFKAANIPTLADMQKRLPAGGLALILVPGEQQSLALWITAEQTYLRLLPGRKRLQAQIQSLASSLKAPTAPMASEAAAGALSTMLFADLPSSSAPKQLWIVADELSAAIPFSALYWPGSSEPLLSSTDISFITGLRADAGQTPIKTPHTATDSVFFAPAYSAAASKELQTLDFADVERASIERESGATWQAFVGQTATRKTFQDLLQTPGLWLHVAAHGRADPGVLGNAGLWLANADGPDADFLSWLELGNLRTQAELLVLNACQSATGAQPSRQANISFALAMSASGANHVVAALWPVSDVASGTWIPEFYRHLALTHQADTTAAALRQAQLRLYHSPHYQHPFYWASLVHFQRLDF